MSLLLNSASRQISLELYQNLIKEYKPKILKTSLPRLDSFLSFQSGITLIDCSSPFLFDFLAFLCVRSILEFDDNVIFVDGGNSINPYTIASLSKRNDLSKDYVLSKIKVCRAFTAYQLSTILDNLGEAVEEYNPSSLIVSCISDLFLDKDIKRNEAKILLRRGLWNIKSLTRKYDLISILTTKSFQRFKGIFNVDRIIKIESKKKCLRITLNNKTMDFYPVPSSQTILEDFLGG